MVTNESLAARVGASGNARDIAGLFIAGVALQILTALIWKAAMWYLYLGEIHPSVKDLKKFKFSDWLSEQFWFEIFVDIATLVLFGLATLKVLLIATAELPAGL
jgi:hypothetical protein